MFRKTACKCHRCVAKRRIRFVLGLGILALIPVGYLALPDHRDNVADHPLNNIADAAVSENRSNNSVPSGDPALSSRAPDSSPEPVAGAGDDKNRPAGNGSEVVSQNETQPVNAPRQEQRSSSPGDEVYGNTSLEGALTRTDESVVYSPKPTSTTSENSDDPLSASKKSSAAPPAAAEHQSIVVAGVRPQPQSTEPDVVDSSSTSGTADPVPQASNLANSPSVASPNPTPAVAPYGDTSEAKSSGSNGALTAVVAIQGNPAAEMSPTPPQTHELRGYITVASKFEPAASPSEEQRPAKPAERRANAEDIPPEPRESAAKTEKRPSSPPKPADHSEQLQSFASDFVRSDGSGNNGEQRRFYADSVHFYHEGDLSLAGVAAATRRYHQNRDNRQFHAAGSATVKGPVDGGFYLLDQPVSWIRIEGSSQVRGRSRLRLRVLPSGQGWKITSIEEIGQ